MAGVVARRGRPRAGEQEERRRAVLEAALAELEENGYEALTMQRIAARAGASKETLYVWFGSREGLLEALIERNADASARRIEAASANQAPMVDTLIGYAIGLLTLLTSPPSIALNRAAMTSPRLAGILLRSGRHRVGPLVERYLQRQHDAGDLHAPDPGAAFRLFYGLVVQDTQIRVLLGEDAPTGEAIARHADEAVRHFLHLCAASRIA